MIYTLISQEAILWTKEEFEKAVKENTSIAGYCGSLNAMHAHNYSQTCKIYNTHVRENNHKW
jgi:hypothetical protein